MLDKITFAKRYSKALFQLLKADHELTAGNSQLIQLRQVLIDTPQLITALNSVSFPEANKKRLVKPLIDNVTSKYVQNLIRVVFACGRMADMVELVHQFELLYDRDQKIVHAQLITAVPLNDRQKAELKRAFATRTGAKKVLFKPVVDRGIIGGVIIKSSNVIFDGSIKTKINNVRQLLLS